MPDSKILYALVARGPVVLAEHANVSGNVNVVAVRILEKLGDEDTRVSYSHEQHLFHVLVSEGIVLLCMANEDFGRRLPFAFLEDVRQRFFAAYSDSCREAVAYEYNTDFAPVLAQRMQFYGSNPAADAIGRVKGEILQVKDVMIENIEKVLERGEKLDLLVDKTDALQGEAFAFRREAKRARRAMWWQNVRMWFVVAAIVVGVILSILMLACGIRFNHC